MADWSKPALNDLYVNFLNFLKARDDDAARLNDSRVTAATNAPDYAKRWNATTGTFQNWLSSAWANLVLAVAGGGTGASTAAGARTNLDVYSKAESDAKYVGEITTVSGEASSPVSLATASTTYNIMSVSLPAGTWLIHGHARVLFSGPKSIYLRLVSGGGATLRTAEPNIGSAVSLGMEVDLRAVVTIGATTTINMTATPTTNGGVVSAAGYTYIEAVKIG